MPEPKFDEILDECLRMLQTGASIDDCVAPYPRHADELRDRLEIAQSLISAQPEIQLDQATQAQNRTRLLAGVAEQLKAAEVEPTLGLVPQIRTLFRGARRLALLPYALPVALVLLLTLGGLTAAAAVLQPDVPIVRDIFGSDSDQPSSVSVPSETPSTSDSDSSSDDELRIEFRGGGCELRGLITSLDPLAVNDIPVDASSASRIRVDLAQAFADGTRVRVKGASVLDNGGRICVADEIRLDDQDIVAVEPPRIEFEGGECELRGLITSLDPLVVNGVPVDDSSASRIRVDLAQAFADGARVRVRGTSIFDDGVRICVADEIRLDDEDTLDTLEDDPSICDDPPEALVAACTNAEDALLTAETVCGAVADEDDLDACEDAVDAAEDACDALPDAAADACDDEADAIEDAAAAALDALEDACADLENEEAEEACEDALDDEEED